MPGLTVRGAWAAPNDRGAAVEIFLRDDSCYKRMADFQRREVFVMKSDRGS